MNQRCLDLKLLVTHVRRAINYACAEWLRRHFAKLMVSSRVGWGSTVVTLHTYQLMRRTYSPTHKTMQQANLTMQCTSSGPTRA